MPSASSLAPLLALAVSAKAFWSVQCSSNALVIERSNPIVNPGTISQHLHMIHGGSGFSLNISYEHTQTSNCVSCQVVQDKSNYCVLALFSRFTEYAFIANVAILPAHEAAGLWFQDPNTQQFEPVPSGGLLVNYLQRGANVTNIKAFPKGFRMVTGDARKRSKQYTEGLGTQQEIRERATVQGACLRSTTGQPDYDAYGFPTTYCEAGFKSRLHLPNCWDGQNLDTADHTSHVAYMSGMDDGVCPPTHPVSLLTLLYEQTWDINGYNSRWTPGVDNWPFVWSTGDPTGYSYHGAFFNGWDIDTLQNAITGCDNNTPDTAAGITASCPFFTVQNATASAACTIPSHINEDVGGPRAKLPGCNPIQPGPGPVQLYGDSNCPA